MAEDFNQTDRNQVRRVPQRGHYDRETIYPIIDEAPICHVGFVDDGRPFVIPTIHGREGDTIYLHGAKASRMLKLIEAGGEVCITVTHLDGLVLARSVFHHSMNYRSAVLFGKGRIVEDEDEKMNALAVVTEHVMPGRWTHARQPNPKEMNATTVVAVDIELASAKVRVGPPGDDDEDYALPVWAGVVPIRQQALATEDDPLLKNGIPVPDYVDAYINGQ